MLVILVPSGCNTKLITVYINPNLSERRKKREKKSKLAYREIEKEKNFSVSVFKSESFQVIQ